MKKIFGLGLILFFMHPAAKAQTGSLDPSLKKFLFDYASYIVSTVVQPDGKIIIYGKFRVFLNGNKIENLLRIDKNGSVDMSFKFKDSIGEIKSILLDPKGRIIITTPVYGYPPFNAKIIRLNPDGSKDPSFNYMDYHVIETLAIQEDGKIIFGTGNTTNLNYLVRLNDDGTFDSSFVFNRFKVNSTIYSIKILPDNKLMIGGIFNRIYYYSNGKPTPPKGYSCKLISKFNADGSLDSTFNIIRPFDLKDWVKNIIIQPDGKILASGHFNSGIARFNKDGSPDNSFNPGSGIEKSADNFIHAMYLQENGKIILGGQFNKFNGIENNHIVRLNADGSIDKEFKTGHGFDKQVICIIPYNRSKIIVAGSFLSYDSSYNGDLIVRLNIKDDSISEKIPLVIYPNPFSQNFKINSQQPIIRLSITDVTGKEVLRTEPVANQVDIDMNGKANGIYFIKAFFKDTVQTWKILKH